MPGSLLVDKYRPRRLSQVLGQERAVAMLRRVVSRADRGRVWIEGPTGVGKSTLAECLGRAAGVHAGNVVTLDGDKCSVGEVRELDAEAQKWNTGFLEPIPTLIIVNEAHAMTARAVQAWLTFMERQPRNWWIAFTTTVDSRTLYGEFSKPFGDRLTYIKLTNQGLAGIIARFSRRVALREGLDGRSPEGYLRLVKDKGNSFRAVLQAIDDLAMID